MAIWRRTPRSRTRTAPVRAGAQRELPDFTQLPSRVPPQDLVTTQDVDPPRDPRGGRDTETEFLLRNAGIV